MAERNWANRRCHVCRQRSLQRVPRPFSYETSHDGRPPVTISIPDLEVIACTNADCKPADPSETIIHDDAATARIVTETYRQLGLLAPAEIREQRERFEWTQAQLQQLLGLGGNTLSRLENGHHYHSRAIDTLLRLVFGLDEVRGFLERRQSVATAPAPPSTVGGASAARGEPGASGPPAAPAAKTGSTPKFAYLERLRAERPPVETERPQPRLADPPGSLYAMAGVEK